MLTQSQLRNIIAGANAIYPGIFGPIEEFEAVYAGYTSRERLKGSYLKRLIKKKGCVLYFAIGEAPPPMAAGTYFYDPAAVRSTPWFRVPLVYFFPTHAFLTARTVANKTDALNQLADIGYYMEDVSPLPFTIARINRSQPRYRKLLEFLFCNYFVPHVIPVVCPLLCKSPNRRTVLIGTKAADRIVYDMFTTGTPCAAGCKSISLKPAGISGTMTQYTLSSACATNSPILSLFRSAIA